jgi:hypothetical protein
MHRNHLPSPGLCKVFELGIDRANEVELLFAPPAFCVAFPERWLCECLPNQAVSKFLVLGPRGKTVAEPPVRASVVEKVRAVSVR